MKKVFTILMYIALACSVVLVAIQLLLGSIYVRSGAAAYLPVFLFICLGAFLMPSKNCIAARIGRGLYIAGSVIMGISSISEIVLKPSNSAIVGLVAFSVFGVFWILVFLRWISTRKVQ